MMDNTNNNPPTKKTCRPTPFSNRAEYFAVIDFTGRISPNLATITIRLDGCIEMPFEITKKGDEGTEAPVEPHWFFIRCFNTYDLNVFRC